MWTDIRIRDMDPCVAGPRERHLESLLHGLLRRSIAVSQHPRTCVQVVLQVCREGGSELAAALNGAVAALVDACVPLHTLLAATCIAATAEGELLVDPSLQEEAVRRCPTFAMSASMCLQSRQSCPCCIYASFTAFPRPRRMQVAF